MARVGSFGDVVFETSLEKVVTFTKLDEARKARYACHDVLNLDQKLQFLGLELDEVELAMSFHHRFCEPEKELGKLKEMVNKHEAHTLGVGGTIFGSFVAQEVRGVWRHVTNRGRLLHAEAQVRLKEYK